MPAISAKGPEPASFVLVLEPAATVAQKIGGLSLALRLALDAQAAGATAIVVPQSAPQLRSALDDARVTVPILTEPPPGTARLRAPSSLLVHRATLRDLAQGLPNGAELSVREARKAPAVAYAFAPIDVTSKEAASAAEHALFRSLRKPQDGWTSTYLNRYISLFISRFLVRTPLRPNQVSVAILGVGLAGAVAAAQGGYWPLLVGALLFQAQSVLDGCDGEMSRVTHRGSRLGEWLDTIGDDLTNYGFFGGAGVGLYRTSGEPLYLVAGGITVLCGLITSAIEYRYLIKIGSGDLLKYPLSQASSGGGKLALIAPLFKRDTFVLLTLVAAACGALGPMLCVFSLGAIGIVFSVFKTELRLAREARKVAG